MLTVEPNLLEVHLLTPEILRKSHFDGAESMPFGVIADANGSFFHGSH